MATWVEIPAPADAVLDEQGNVVPDVAVTLKLAGTSTDVTHASDTDGTDPQTGNLYTRSDGSIGTLTERRYIRPGAPASLTVGSSTRLLQPVSAATSGGVLNVTSRGVNPDLPGDQTTGIMAADAAAAAAGVALSFPAGSYVGAGFTPTTTWIGEPGAMLVITTGSTSNLVTLGDATSDLTVSGFELDMTAASGASTASAVNIGGTRNKLLSCFIHDCPEDGVSVRTGASYIYVWDLDVVTTGSYGIMLQGTSGSPVTHTVVEANRVKDSGDGATGINGVGRFCAFLGNMTENSGGDGCAAYNTDNAYITVANNTWNNPGNHGCHIGGDHLSVTGNKVYSPAQRGIYIAALSSPAKVGALVEGNEVHTTGAGEGILIDNYTGVVVGPNLVLSPQTHSLSLIDCKDFSVTGGTYKGSVAGCGLRFAGCQDGAASGFTSKGNADKGISFVIGISGTPDCLDITLTGATIKGNTGAGVHSTTNASGLSISGNTIKGNTAGNFSVVSKSTNRIGQNAVDATDFASGTEGQVASASSVTLPLGRRNYVISGTTTITALAAGNWADRVVTLRFTAAASGVGLTSSDMIRLASDYAWTANDTITLQSDGSRWYEVCRSVNEDSP